jgi:hypothetical protein
MPHLLLDDGFPDHPRVWSLSDGAYRLHSSAMCFCARLKTDGFIPADQVKRLMPRFRPAYVAELIDAERWMPVGIGDTVVSYEIRNYLEWNSSAQQIEDRRKASEERKRRWKERNENK